MLVGISFSQTVTDPRLRIDEFEFRSPLHAVEADTEWLPFLTPVPIVSIYPLHRSVSCETPLDPVECRVRYGILPRDQQMDWALRGYVLEGDTGDGPQRFWFYRGVVVQALPN